MSKKFYAVAVGYRPGIYEDWQTCQAQVKGFSKAIYKSFATRDEANAFLQAKTAGSGSSGPSRSLYASGVQQSPYGSSSTSYSSYRSNDNSDSYSSSSHSGYSVPPQSVPVSGTTSISLAPNPSSNASNESSHASLSSSVTVTSKDSIIVYTDGACSRNGQKGSAAGLGVYFGPNDPRNLSEPLTGTKQTNQRAELMAGLRAMEVVDDDVNLEIKSDSAYLVNGMNSWIDKWQKKHGGVRSHWQGVENEDLFRSLAQKRSLRKGATIFTHVPAHSGIPGNEEADRLAVAGIRK